MMNTLDTGVHGRLRWQLAAPDTSIVRTRDVIFRRT